MQNAFIPQNRPGRLWRYTRNILIVLAILAAITAIAAIVINTWWAQPFAVFLKSSFSFPYTFIYLKSILTTIATNAAITSIASKTFVTSVQLLRWINRKLSITRRVNVGVRFLLRQGIHGIITGVDALNRFVVGIGNGIIATARFIVRAIARIGNGIGTIAGFLIRQSVRGVRAAIGALNRFVVSIGNRIRAIARFVAGVAVGINAITRFII